MSTARLTTARFAIVIACTVFLQACASTAHFSASVPNTKLAIKGIERVDLPRTEELGSKATGQYEFMATPPSGTPIYGILPLRVNGGKMAASILFFAPALFIGGFRDAFGYYEFDPASNFVRYKANESDEWVMYQPTKSESDRARATFGALAKE